jgi:hypothetical protein
VSNLLSVALRDVTLHIDHRCGVRTCTMIPKG